MSETPWAHLPNAAVIDDLIADALARREAWKSGWFAAFNTANEMVQRVSRVAAFAAPRGASRIAATDGVRDAAWTIGLAAARYAFRGSAIALVAWDASANLLALTPDALRTIIDTCEGDVKHQAVLLLPAVIARSTP
jgi:hypothetical protein